MEIRSFVLCNAAGDEICISNYGARLLQWHTEIDAVERNIILGYPSLNDYLKDPAYLGAIVGPFANRIGGAQFSDGDKIHQLDANEGIHHLHGGRNSISDMYWDIVEQTQQSITMTCTLADGHNGYPGDITFKVTYRLNDEGGLIIDMFAETKKPTAISTTSHPYFNLAGVGNDHHHHVFRVFADKYTEVDEKNIPTGDFIGVEGTSLDFRQPHIISHEPSRDCVDHNFVVNDVDGPQAILISPDKKLQLHVTTDYPGVQVYTGHFLDGKFSSKEGLCIEPQFFPNSPNIEHFPFALTTPEKPFKAQIRYQLVKK